MSNEFMGEAELLVRGLHYENHYIRNIFCYHAWTPISLCVTLTFPSLDLPLPWNLSPESPIRIIWYFPLGVEWSSQMAQQSWTHIFCFLPSLKTFLGKKKVSSKMFTGWSLQWTGELQPQLKGHLLFTLPWRNMIPMMLSFLIFLKRNLYFLAKFPDFSKFKA